MNSQADRAAWYRKWFGSEYLKLYPHRDASEAAEGVALLRREVGRSSGARVLDVGCGPGRHLAALIRAGFSSVGIDLSPTMIATAWVAAPEAHLVRADMRQLPIADASFDIVTSYFTSFGYFEDERDDQQVIHEARRVLATGGWYLLDFLNSAHVAATLKREDRSSVAGAAVVQRRRLANGGRLVEKRIRIESRGPDPDREFVERVRLYHPQELDEMLRRGGLRPVRAFGAYDGSPHSDTSPRYIVLNRALS